MPIYLLQSNGVYISYLGQSLQTITALLAERGLTGTVVSESEFLNSLKVR